MPLGVVNDNDFELEISKCIKIGEVIQSPNKGRGPQREVPDSLRRIIGEESEINGRKEGVALAKQFGISPSSVSSYANGSTSTASYNQPKSSITDHINRVKERITKKAKNRLILALNEITPEKLAEAKLKDISSVAKDMSGIIKDMQEDSQDRAGQNSNVPQFIVYSPQFKKEEYYDTIIVNE